ncbi:MAG: hypothetical protein ACTHJ3_18080 [Pararhizobium sp.]
MIDRPKNTRPDTSDVAHPNAPGARQEQKAPESPPDKPVEEMPSPKTDKNIDPVKQADGKSAVPKSGTPSTPVEVNALNNMRSKKFRA